MYYRRANVYSDSRPMTLPEAHVVYANTCSIIPHLDHLIANCDNPRRLAVLERDLQRWENLAAAVFPIVTHGQFVEVQKGVQH